MLVEQLDRILGLHGGVFGAVLTQEYADKIGADKYARDAMEAVRYAEEINKAIN